MAGRKGLLEQEGRLAAATTEVKAIGGDDMWLNGSVATPMDRDVSDGFIL